MRKDQFPPPLESIDSDMTSVISSILRYLGSAMLALAAEMVSATPTTIELTALGEQLFNDSRLSASRVMSCSSCHAASARFADVRSASIDVAGEAVPRSAPSLLDLSRHREFFWDGRHSDLETAILEPLTNPREHGFASLEDAFSAINGTPQYRGMLSQPGDLLRALALYLRSLPPAPDLKTRIPADGIVATGAKLFSSTAGCANCHLDLDRPANGKDSYHARNIDPAALADALTAINQNSQALRDGKITPELAPLGRFIVTGNIEDIGRFRTPSLLHAAGTAPFMHDGSIKTLREAIVHEVYYTSKDHGASLAPREIDALVALMEWMDAEACKAYADHCRQIPGTGANGPNASMDMNQNRAEQQQ